MAYRPRFAHLWKVMFGLKDHAAAEGLFLEGQLEYEAGNTADAKLMFYFGRRLNPAFAGNFYNYAVVIEKTEGQTRKALKAWEEYLGAAAGDPKQSAELQERVRKHVEDMKGRLNK